MRPPRRRGHRATEPTRPPLRRGRRAAEAAAPPRPPRHRGKRAAEAAAPPRPPRRRGCRTPATWREVYHPAESVSAGSPRSSGISAVGMVRDGHGADGSPSAGCRAEARPRRQRRRQEDDGRTAAAQAPARGGRAQPQAHRGAGYTRRVAGAASWCGGLAYDGVSFAFLCGTLWNVWGPGPELRPGTAASASAELGAGAGAVRCDLWDIRLSTSAAVSWPYHVGNHRGGLGCFGPNGSRHGEEPARLPCTGQSEVGLVVISAAARGSDGWESIVVPQRCGSPALRAAASAPPLCGETPSSFCNLLWAGKEATLGSGSAHWRTASRHPPAPAPHGRNFHRGRRRLPRAKGLGPDHVGNHGGGSGSNALLNVDRDGEPGGDPSLIPSSLTRPSLLGKAAAPLRPPRHRADEAATPPRPPRRRGRRAAEAAAPPRPPRRRDRRAAEAATPPRPPRHRGRSAAEAAAPPRPPHPCHMARGVSPR